MPSRLKRRPRVLCYVVHYYRTSDAYHGTSRAYVGRSTNSAAEQRRAVVTQVIDALRALPGRVDVKVCGVPEAALVPIDIDLSAVREPQHFSFEAIEHMVRSRAGYDWFVCVEDDVLISSGVFDRMRRFERDAELNEVLLPNRLEESAPGRTYCVDLLAHPGWRGDRREYEGLRLDIATNPHSGLISLSRRQLDYAITRVDLTRRDVTVGGYLTSALANLHEPFLLWRTRDDLDAHHVRHLDTWTSAAPIIHLAGNTIDRTPPDVRGHVDSLTLDRVICTVDGWAVDAEGRAVAPDTLRLGGAAIPRVRVETRARPDVRAARADVEERCGFRAVFSLLDLPQEHLSATSLEVRGGEFALTAEWPAALALRAVDHAPEVPDGPCLPAAAEARFRELVTAAPCTLEYGAGGCTVLAAELGVPRVYCVDGDLPWLAAVEHRVGRIPSRGRVAFLHADVGAVTAEGYPVGLPEGTAAGDYALRVWARMRADSVSPGVVLIDGRFRVACFLASLLHATPGTRIMFNGYPGNPAYEVVEQVLPPDRVHTGAAEFEVPEGLSRERAWDLLSRHVGDAR